MILLRKLLFPFAILYGLLTSLRIYLYDKGIFKSYSFDIPVIVVGNLSVGGTGKTPQIEYLIRLLSSKYRIATLSRGYKRKSKGFVLADANSNAEILGDEPFQYFKKFPEIKVAVDADRQNGIKQLLNQKEKPEVILLDDAFQHLRVRAGFYILLTSFDDLFIDDFILPMGNLRETRNGAKRANMIIVSKCPTTISQLEQETIKKKIGFDIPIFFSFIDYDDKVYNQNDTLEVSEIKSKEKVLLAGIANPKPFFDYLKTKNDEILTFSDHHHFSESEIINIKNIARDKVIITTEKDFVRLNSDILAKQLYYLPIKSKFIDYQETFDKFILNYVGTCSRNR
ncbi:MAG: tetraacyldisaccharide 4'-kinase [Flavobacterium sp.]|nr:tetraacyldisaccharide 4'-kinase [Flavobacterium sp.]